VMHACGHDAHTAILLTVARMFNDMKDRPPGEIRLLFQPSEEDEDDEHKSGGLRMVEEGALDGLDAVIALHVASGMPSGKIGIMGGPSAAAVDSFEATIIGEGCHGAYPQFGIDPIYLFAQVVNAVHGNRARRINPTRPSMLSFGAVHGGDANNVIPAEIKCNGTIRSYDDETRNKLWEELEKAFSVTRALGGDYKLEISKGYPSLYNNPGVASTIREIGHAILGDDGIFPEERHMGAEDFAYMTQTAPGAMFNLGAKLGEVNRPHHSPIFDLDESSFPLGVAILAETTLHFLKNGVTSTK
jgi:amidohydrolase